MGKQKSRRKSQSGRDGMSAIGYLGLAVLAVVSIGLAGVALSQNRAEPSIAAPEKLTDLYPTVAPREGTVLFIGDSYTSGYALLDPHTAYPYVTSTALNTNVAVAAEQTSGWTRPGIDKHTIPDLITLVGNSGAETIVIAAGLNDALIAAPAPDVTSAAVSGLQAVVAANPESRIVLVGPFSPGPPTPEIASVRDATQAAASQIGVTFIDASEWLSTDLRGKSGLIGKDGLHPSKAGASLLGVKLAEAMQAI